MSGFNYSEPDDSGTSLTAIRNSSGLFYIQAEREDGDESMSIAVRMSPDKAIEFAHWILGRCAVKGETPRTDAYHSSSKLGEKP